MNATETAAALASNAETVCRHFLPNGRKQGNYWIAGDIDGARGRSFVVRLAGPSHIGKWNDYSSGEHGDLLDLIQHRTNASNVTEAIAHARAFLSLPDNDPTSARAAPEAYDGTKAARRIWQRSLPIADTHAEAYLRARGILHSRYPALRFHPALSYRDGTRRERLPALIAAVTEHDHRISGLHRTYLHPARPAKADVPNPRKTLGHIRSHAVRLRNATPPTHTLLVAEGIETTLSIAAAIPTAGAAAALSATNLAAFTPPPEVRRVLIARDRDTPGLQAAEALHRTCLDQGVHAIILCPAGTDWNEDLTELGTDALAEHASHLFRTAAA